VLATIISVLVFGTLFGFLGVLVSIPLVADMVVVWRYLNRYLEKDSIDYDEVNSYASGPREVVSPDNTSISPIRSIFLPNLRRRDAAEPSPGPAHPATEKPVSPARVEGVDGLAQRRASDGKTSIIESS